MTRFEFLLSPQCTRVYLLASSAVLALCMILSINVELCIILFIAVVAVFLTTYFSRWFVALSLAASLDLLTNVVGIQRGLSLVVVFLVTHALFFFSERSAFFADLRAAITTGIFGVIWPLFVYDTPRTKVGCSVSENVMAYGNGTSSVLVFVHGGGWCTGGFEEWLGHRLAHEYNCTVALVTYPKCVVPVRYCLRVYAMIAAAALPVAVFASSYTGTVLSWLALALPIYACAVHVMSQRTFTYLGQSASCNYAEQVKSLTKTLDDLQTRLPTAKFAFVGHSAGAALLLSYIVGRLEAGRPIGGKYALLSGPYDFCEMQEQYTNGHFANVFKDLRLTDASPLHRLARCESRYVLTNTEAVYAVTSQSDFPFLNRQSTALATTWTSVVRLVLDSERGHGMGLISDDRVWKVLMEKLIIWQ